MAASHIGKLGLAPDSVLISKYRQDIGEPEGIVLKEPVEPEPEVKSKKQIKHNADLPV